MPASTIRRYHEQTKHRPARFSATPHGLEWTNVRHPFKQYRGLEPEPVPRELERLLPVGAAVHPRRGDPHFRTFMSAGALHPVELYVAAGAGLWHYHPGERALRRLRGDDARAALADAAAAPELSFARVVLVVTGILWRTAWKCGARGWRMNGRALGPLSPPWNGSAPRSAPAEHRVIGAGDHGGGDLREAIRSQQVLPGGR